MCRLKLILTCITVITIFSITSAEILNSIPDGILRGAIKNDRFGNEFFSFQSIPYAKPPIGNLRFKDPIPNDPWDGIKDATSDLPFCYQFDENLIGEEDCLYLNVYTPSLNATNLPVMVFIHGGSFITGSGRQDYYSPEFLIPENVLLVTLNYRLNIFGFFSLDDLNFGNAGLKDQRLALEWVQKNIKYFGGDPDKVTIFGQSAGGACVHLHVLSPQSKGLFSNAIMQSGVATSPWLVGVPNNGKLLAEVLQISTDDVSNMLLTLQLLPAATIFGAFQLLSINNPMRWGGFHVPIVEKQTNGTAFLIDEPLNLIKEGNYNKVPLLIGYTDAEGIYFEQFLRNLTGQITPLTDFFAFVPDELGISPGTPEALELGEELRRFYEGDESPPDNLQPFIDIYRDTWFALPGRKAALEHAKTNENPIYFYRFSADTAMNVYKNRDEISMSYKGASHCDDLSYMLQTFITPKIEENSVEDFAVNRVVKMWTNFAKTSNPNFLSDDDWRSVSDGVMNYVDIGSNENKSGVDPDDVNVQFWLDIFERYGV
nr:juvenile hormone esterase-like [Onthophagus taurus]